MLCQSSTCLGENNDCYHYIPDYVMNTTSLKYATEFKIYNIFQISSSVNRHALVDSTQIAALFIVGMRQQYYLALDDFPFVIFNVIN